MKTEIHKIIYSCDYCKKEVKSKEDLYKYVIPMTLVNEYRIPCKVRKVTDGEIELCEDCSKKLNDVIEKHFHRFRYAMFGGVEG